MGHYYEKLGHEHWAGIRTCNVYGTQVQCSSNWAIVLLCTSQPFVHNILHLEWFQAHRWHFLSHWCRSNATQLLYWTEIGCWRSVILCFYPLFSLPWPLVNVIFATHAARFANCGGILALERKFYPNFLISLSLFGYFALLFANYRTYKTVKKHFDSLSAVRNQQQTNNNNGSMNNMIREREILVATLIQGAIPMLFCIPMTLSAVRILAYGFHDDLIRAKIEVLNGRSLYEIAGIIYLLNPIIDSIATLAVVKPYRVAAFRPRVGELRTRMTSYFDDIIHSQVLIGVTAVFTHPKN